MNRSNGLRTIASRVRRAFGVGATGPGSPHTAPSQDQQPDLTNASAMFAWCLQRGDTSRPQYLWPSLQAARIARALGHERISFIEFGVAGGNGLLALESAAARAESLVGVDIEVHGFDTGKGMPEPVDHRDVPWVIRPGWFEMDEAALRARLTRAQLVLGPVAETVAGWVAGSHAPIGFISFDLDYYSSTMQAFRVLDSAAEALLPRVACYFDDIFGYGWSDFNGERAAIADFNRAHEHRKIGAVYGLRYELPPSEFQRAWPDQMYLAHIFDHPRYNESEGAVNEEWFEALRLRNRPSAPS